MAVWRNRLLLVDLEGTYGTNPGVDGTDALVLSELEVTPLEIDLVDRELITGYFGNTEKVVGARMSKAEFSVELAGSGTVATAPRYGRLLRACGFAETITAATNVIYAPVSTGIESVTLSFYADGTRHLILGARGTFSLSMESGVIPKLEFEFTGLYVPAAAEANPTATFGQQAAPLAMNSANTTGATIHGYAAPLEEFELDMENEVVFRQLAGADEFVYITDRKPEGTVKVEAPALGDKDYFAAAASQALGVVSVTHGVTAGNIVTINAPSCNLGSPEYADSDGVMMLEMSFMPNPVSGNDELTFTFT